VPPYYKSRTILSKRNWLLLSPALAKAARPVICQWPHALAYRLTYLKALSTSCSCGSINWDRFLGRSPLRPVKPQNAPSLSTTAGRVGRRQIRSSHARKQDTPSRSGWWDLGRALPLRTYYCAGCRHRGGIVLLPNILICTQRAMMSLGMQSWTSRGKLHGRNASTQPPHFVSLRGQCRRCL